MLCTYALHLFAFKLKSGFIIWHKWHAVDIPLLDFQAPFFPNQLSNVIFLYKILVPNLMNTVLLKDVSRKLNWITIKHNLFQSIYMPFFNSHLTSSDEEWENKVGRAAWCKRSPLNWLLHSPESENHFLVFKITKFVSGVKSLSNIWTSVLQNCMKKLPQLYGKVCTEMET